MVPSEGFDSPDPIDELIILANKIEARLAGHGWTLEPSSVKINTQSILEFVCYKTKEQPVKVVLSEDEEFFAIVKDLM